MTTTSQPTILPRPHVPSSTFHSAGEKETSATRTSQCGLIWRRKTHDRVPKQPTAATAPQLLLHESPAPDRLKNLARIGGYRINPTASTDHYPTDRETHHRGQNRTPQSQRDCSLRCRRWVASETTRCHRVRPNRDSALGDQAFVRQ